MDKKYLFTLIYLFSCLLCCAQQVITIDIPVTLNQHITSKDYHDLVSMEIATVSNNVYWGDSIVISQGTPVTANVESKKASVLGEPGKIKLDFILCQDVNGRPIKLSYHYFAIGKDRETSAYILGIGLGLFTLVGYLGLLLKGSEAEISEGSTFIVKGYLYE